MCSPISKGSTTGLLLAAADMPLNRLHWLCDGNHCRAKNAAEVPSLMQRGDFQRASELATIVPTPEPEHHQSKIDTTPCSCREQYADKEQVMQIIESGDLPLFSYNRTTNGLEIHHGKFTDEFIAFSHTWIDGFGNDEIMNFIYHCNLRFLDGLCRRLLPTQNEPKFWLDSLGLPVGDAYRGRKAAAVKQIHRIYHKASHTIVLDAGLLYRNDPTQVEEQAIKRGMRLTTSTWITRIWTFQEAYLSRRLFVALGATAADSTLIEIDDMKRNLERVKNTADLKYSSSMATEFHGRTLRDKPRVDDIDESRNAMLDPHFVARVYEAVQYRTAGKPDDVPQALSILFDFEDCFDEAKVFRLPGEGIPAEKRMQMLTKCLCNTRSDQCAIPAGKSVN